MFSDAKEFGDLFSDALSWIAAPWFGPIVFAVGVILFLWAHYDWKRGSNFFDSLYADYGMSHPMISLVVICLIGALIGATVFGKTWKYIAKRHSSETASNRPHSDRPDAKRSNESEAIAPLALRVKFTQNGLPIQVLPGQTIHFYAIRQDKSVQIFLFRNDFSQTTLWPTHEKIFPPEFIGIAAISVNRTVFKFSMKMKFDYGGTFATDNLQIDSIRPEEEALIYFVNQSNFHPFIHFPDSAILEVERQSGKQAAPIQFDGLYSKVSPLIPEALSPSNHRWEGNKMLEPTQKPSR